MKNDEKGDISLDIIYGFSSALETLDRYDHQQLEFKDGAQPSGDPITYDDAMEAIALLKENFHDSDIFGMEKDDSFKSSLAQIYQTFDGKELYPAFEEKAAMLLYLIVKNHSFVDGNKRIAAYIFLWFLMRNNMLYKWEWLIFEERREIVKRISDAALVAITLLIAQSKPEEKETMVKLVMNFLVM